MCPVAIQLRPGHPATMQAAPVVALAVGMSAGIPGPVGHVLSVAHLAQVPDPIVMLVLVDVVQVLTGLHPMHPLPDDTVLLVANTINGRVSVQALC